MPTIDQVLRAASRLVTPTVEEEQMLARVASKVTSLLERSFAKDESRVRPEISLGGSYAKGTWLKGSADIDCFLLYPVSYPREKIETEAIEAALDAVRGYRVNMRYAEHPYVEAFVEKVRVNLVPCYKVARGDWQSAADRSPYHTQYIKSKYDDKLRLEARLLKKFIKSAGVYGAEVKVQGFSGYVCEVLTLKYGSFRSVLESLSKVSQGEIISVESYDKDLAESFRSPLVILDPVDTGRNLGSAISVQNVAKLVLRCRRFLANPDFDFFFPERPRRAKVTETQADLLSRVVAVTFQSEKRSVDILWGQLRKSGGALSAKLAEMGFDVLRASAASDENGNNAFIFLFLERRISRLQLRYGPEFFRAKEVNNYLSKSKDRYLLSWIGEEGRVESMLKRDEPSIDAATALKNLLSDEKKVEKIGISKAIRGEILNRFKVQGGQSIMRSKAKSKKWLSEAVLSLVSSETELDHRADTT